MRLFSNILVLCDTESAPDAALDRATRLAADGGVRVTLVDVVQTDDTLAARLFDLMPHHSDTHVIQDIMSVRTARLAQLVERLADCGVQADLQVLRGTLHVEVVRAVLRDGYDLVLKGKERSSGHPHLRGADMRLMRKCPCPVWVLTSTAEPATRRILAAVNPDRNDAHHTALSRSVLDAALAIADEDHARLDVIHAWWFEEEWTLRHSLANVPSGDVDALIAQFERTSRAALDTLVAKDDRIGDGVRILHIKGEAADVIAEHVAAEGIDTVVIGTIGRTGIAGMLIGNTAETVMSHVTCSVLALKPDDFTSPIQLEETV